MEYITTCAVSIKGDRVRKGTIVELTADEAKALSTSVEPLGPVVEATPEEEVEKTLEEMSHEELKALAKELGLKVSGSMADLVERITLHRQATPEEEVTSDN